MAPIPSLSPSPGPAVFPLLSFPNELLLMIASNLAAPDLASLVLTARYLHSLITPELYTVGSTLCDDDDETPLHWAAENDCANVALRLLRRGANPSAQTKEVMETPLHRAVMCGHLELTKLLLENGSSMEARDTDGKTPIHSASWSGKDKVVEYMLSKHPGAIRYKSSHVELTPLHYATKAGQVTTVSLLMRLGADVNAPDVGHTTPLHMAAQSGYYTICKALLENGASLANVEMQSTNTPLHRAAFEGHEKIVRLFIAAGAQMCRNSAGETPLHSALSYMHENAVKVFLENDKSGDLIKILCSAGQPLLTYAFLGPKHPSLLMIQLLIDHGANVNRPAQPNGFTPLHCATSSNNLSLAKLLIDKGAIVTVIDNFGSTPLHEAASFGRIALINLLLESGAEINAEDSDGQTPLYCAVERGRETDVVKLLVEKGADVNVEDACGMSPLSRACAQCCVHVNVEMVRLLIHKGADVRSKDVEGMTALHHAAREGHLEIAKLLVKEGAKVRERNRSGENALNMAESYAREPVIEMLRQAMGMVKWG